MPSLTTMHIMGPSKNQERQKRSQDQIYSSKIWQKYSEVELKRFNWPVVICLGIATWRGPIPELLKVPWYYIFSAWVKITTRQGKLQGKSVTRRVCLSFASATPTHHCCSIIEQNLNCCSIIGQNLNCWSIIEQIIIADLSLNKRTSLISDGVWDLGQDFLCAAQGSMGRTLGQGDNSQIDCCARPLIFFFWCKHFSYFLGLYGLSSMSGNGSVKQQVSKFIWILEIDLL